MSNVQKKLNKISRSRKSDFLKDAEYRIKNKKWLRYSSKIARRIIAVIEDRKDLTQISLAKQVGVSPQYINKVIQGQQNLSLETIGKLSDALQFELIIFPEYKYSYSTNIKVKFDFLVIDNNLIDAEIIEKIIQKKPKELPSTGENNYIYSQNTLTISQKFIQTLPELNQLVQTTRKS